MTMVPHRLLILTAALFITTSALAAERTPENVLPKECAPGWPMDGKVATYTADNLYKYIDGEAELYIPYGFRKAATVMYAKPEEKGIGVVANIFEMGSLLDAFGIYANYRGPALEQVRIGAEGFVEESQFMFYQDHYFVQLEASGALDQSGPLFQSCAETISRNLPDRNEKPRELEILKVPGAVPLTEKYYPSGLLGHNFFGRGFTGEVAIGKAQAKSVLMLGDSKEATARIFSDYEKYLKESNIAPRISIGKEGAALHTVDPLYKGVVLQQSGRYIVGVVGLKDPREGDALVEQLLKRLAER